MLPKPTLVFDFDGTLADTLPHLLALSNRLAPEYGYRRVSEEDIETLRGLHAREVIRWLRVPWYQLPRLARRFRTELRHEMPLVAPIESIPNTLNQLARHFSLGIVTTNSVNNVRAFLTTQRINHFTFVYSSRRLLGKQHTLKQALRQQGLVATRTLYIGDEVRDVEAARACGLDAVAVGWGANDVPTLAQAKPYAIVHHPDELLKIVDAWTRARRSNFG